MAPGFALPSGTDVLQLLMSLLAYQERHRLRATAVETPVQAERQRHTTPAPVAFDPVQLLVSVFCIDDDGIETAASDITEALQYPANFERLLCDSQLPGAIPLKGSGAIEFPRQADAMLFEDGFHDGLTPSDCRDPHLHRRAASQCALPGNHLQRKITVPTHSAEALAKLIMQVLPGYAAQQFSCEHKVPG